MRLGLKLLAGSLVTAGAVALIPIVIAGAGEAPKPAATPSVEVGPPPNENARPAPCRRPHPSSRCLRTLVGQSMPRYLPGQR